MESETYVFDGVGLEIGYIQPKENGKYLARCYTKGISVLRDGNNEVILFDSAEIAKQTMIERYRENAHR
jgi:hypothetical protein